MSYDFSRLSVAQQELLTLQGWKVGQCYPDGSAHFQPSKKAVQKLIDRGLVIRHERHERTGMYAMSVTEYVVPIAVHMAWCERCSKQCGKGA